MTVKVLHILDHSLPVHSGYAFRSQSILLTQKKQGIDALAVTSPKHYESWRGPWLEEENVGGVQYYRTKPIQTSSFPLVSEIRVMSHLATRLRELIRRECPRVLHAHSPTLNAIPTILVGKQTGVPVVYEVRSSWEDAAVNRGTYGQSSWKYKLGRWMETLACLQANHITVLCEGLKQDLIARGIQQGKLTVIPNGVDIEMFQPGAPDQALIEKWNLKGKRVIGFMGSFFRWEGLDLLVEAFARMSRARGDVALLLVGDGEMRQELQDKVRQLGLNNVIMPGSVEPARIPKIYAMVDVLAYPRQSMRLTELVTPLKPLEAMAMGKAVVASDVGGHRELIENGRTGLLFKAGAVERLLEALNSILDNDVLRRSLENEGRAWVQRERPWIKTTHDYLSIYNALSL